MSFDIKFYLIYLSSYLLFWAKLCSTTSITPPVYVEKWSIAKNICDLKDVFLVIDTNAAQVSNLSIDCPLIEA